MASKAVFGGDDERSEPRDVVHHRTRGLHPDGRLLALTIVNISQGGLMTRCDAACEVGDRLRIELPLVGPVVAEVRWALGGRLGCRFDQALAPADYYTALARLRR